MQIKNINVAFLNESICRSGYPMKTGEPEDLEDDSLINDIYYWINNDKFYDIINRINYTPPKSKKTDILWHRKSLNEIKLSVEDNCAIIVLRNNLGEITGECKIDYDYILQFKNEKFGLSNTGYATNSVGIPIHKLICPNFDIVDHINRDRLDNRINNLRESSFVENNQNKSITDKNTSGIIGVNYRKDRNKFRAFITYNRRQISLGNFDLIEDAIIARLNAEVLYFKHNAPQSYLFDSYNILNPYKIEIENEEIPNLAKVLKNYKRIKTLASSKGGDGHDNALKGIIVQFDIRYSQYFALQLQRYNFVDIISSQSKMHKLTSIEDIGGNCNEYVLDRIINEVNILIEIYNDNDFPYGYSVFSTNPEGEDVLLIKDKNHCFQYIISNLPMGFELWMGVSTNYLQLKTIYQQRKHHKLYDWKEFCDFIEHLPMADLIIN